MGDISCCVRLTPYPGDFIRGWGEPENVSADMLVTNSMEAATLLGERYATYTIITALADCGPGTTTNVYGCSFIGGPNALTLFKA